MPFACMERRQGAISILYAVIVTRRDGKVATKSITELQAGDSILVRIQAKGTHLGRAVGAVVTER